LASAKKGRTVNLKCKASKSIFTNEVFITIELPDGEVLTSLANTSQVVLYPPRSLDAEESVDAWVRVSVVDRIKDKLLIDLPRETFSSGSRVLVPETMVAYSSAG